MGQGVVRHEWGVLNTASTTFRAAWLQRHELQFKAEGYCSLTLPATAISPFLLLPPHAPSPYSATAPSPCLLLPPFCPLCMQASHSASIFPSTPPKGKGKQVEPGGVVAFEGLVLLLGG